MEERLGREFERYAGEYRPLIVSCWGATLIVWREPNRGWTYRIYWAEDGVPGELKEIDAMVFADWDRDGCIHAALRHLADTYWKLGDPWPTWMPQKVRDEVQHLHELRCGT